MTRVLAAGAFALLAVCLGLMPASAAQNSSSHAAAAAHRALHTAVPAPLPGDVTLTFSEFAVGTAITNQYQPQGILFGGDSPFITNDSASPTSPVLSGTPAFQGAIEGSFVDP